MATKYPTMNWELPNTAEAFKIFKQKLLLVCEDNEIKEDKKIARKIMIGIDDEGLKRLNASNLTEDDKEKPAKLWKFFEDQLRVSVNFRIHRLALMQYRQQEGESLDEFVTRARTLGQQCNFEEKDLQERIIELIIASTPMEPFRRELLGKGPDLTLEDVVKEGRQHEAAFKGTQQLEDLYKSHPQMTVHVIKNDKKAKHKQCSNCGRKHKYRDCPAYNSECSYCGNMGHWKEFCRKLKRDDQENQSTLKKQPRFTQKSRRIHAVDQPSENESGEDEDAYTSNTPRSRFHTLSLSDKCFDAITSDTAFTDLDIKLPQKPGQYKLQVKIDTGANANTLPLRTFRQMYPKQNVNDIVHRATDAKLTSYSGDNIKCIGTMNIDCKYQTSAWNDTKLYVVDVPGPPCL